MRATIFAAFILIGIYLGFAVRKCAGDHSVDICGYICSVRGRHLTTVEPGVVVKCYCGSRIEKRSMERP